MSNQALSGRKVAVLATDGFEQSELEKPVEALKAAGATVEVVSPKAGEIQGWEHHDKGRTVAVDRELAAASPQDYDSLVLPGGVINPDALRLEPQAIAFIKHFAAAKKPIAAICHGPWTLINAGAVEGKEMTSWPSLEIDLRNAGAKWVDRACPAEPRGRGGVTPCYGGRRPGQRDADREPRRHRCSVRNRLPDQAHGVAGQAPDAPAPRVED